MIEYSILNTLYKTLFNTLSIEYSIQDTIQYLYRVFNDSIQDTWHLSSSVCEHLTDTWHSIDTWHSVNRVSSVCQVSVNTLWIECQVSVNRVFTDTWAQVFFVEPRGHQRARICCFCYGYYATWHSMPLGILSICYTYEYMLDIWLCQVAYYP